MAFFQIAYPSVVIILIGVVRSMSVKDALNLILSRDSNGVIYLRFSCLY